MPITAWEFSFPKVLGVEWIIEGYIGPHPIPNKNSPSKQQYLLLKGIKINNIPKKLIIPLKSYTNKQAIDYLKNRGIDEDIINYCINNRLLYQEKKTNNVVFLGYDNLNNIKYAGCRSTNEKRIMRDAKGSSKDYSFRLISNIPYIYLRAALIYYLMQLC